jgi:hypothetical protein
MIRSRQGQTPDCAMPSAFGRGAGPTPGLSVCLRPSLQRALGVDQSPQYPRPAPPRARVTSASHRPTPSDPLMGVDASFTWNSQFQRESLGVDLLDRSQWDALDRFGDRPLGCLGVDVIPWLSLSSGVTPSDRPPHGSPTRAGRTGTLFVMRTAVHPTLSPGGRQPSKPVSGGSIGA